MSHSENNVRDLCLAYTVVGVCYGVIGGSAYLSYGQTGEIPQNFLKLMSETGILSLLARGFVVLQLFSVYPILLFVIRIQFFGLFWGSPYPSFWHVLGLNFAVAACTTLFAMFFPNIATVLRFTGAFCGFVYVFALPIGVHWSLQRKKNQLTPFSLVFHGLILLIGVASLVSQMF